MKRAFWEAIGLTVAIVVLMIAVIGTARAQGQITYNWVNTTLNTDGSTLAPTAITSSTILYGPCTGSGNTLAVGTPTQTLTAQGGVTHATTPTVAPGQWCATVNNNAGSIAGVPSNPVSVTVATLQPGAPAVQTPTSTGGLKTTGTAVFLVTQIPNGYAFTQVGTVPVGSPCIANSGVNAYNVVDQTQTTVSFSTAVQPLAVVALCQ